MCAGQPCYFDARCLTTSTDPYNGVGCGAGGYPSCRACYVDAYNSILTECPELPSPPSPPPPPSPALPGSITTITLQVVIGFVAAEPIEAFTTARLNNIAVWVAAELGVGPSNVQVIASAASTRVDIIITTATANATAAIEESMASSISNASVASSFFGLTVTSAPTITSRTIVTIIPPAMSAGLTVPDAGSGAMRTVLIAVGAGSLLCGIPAILLVIRCRRRRARSVGPMPADEKYRVATHGVSCDARRYDYSWTPKPLASAPPGRSAVTDAVGLVPSLLPRLGAVMGAAAISHTTTALEP